MNKFYQELFGVLTRARHDMSRQSKSASLQQQQPEKGKEMITICKKEYQYLLDNKCANVIKQE